MAPKAPPKILPILVFAITHFRAGHFSRVPLGRSLTIVCTLGSVFIRVPLTVDTVPCLARSFTVVHYSLPKSLPTCTTNWVISISGHLTSPGSYTTSLGLYQKSAHSYTGAHFQTASRYPIHHQNGSCTTNRVISILGHTPSPGLYSPLHSGCTRNPYTCTLPNPREMCPSR